ncbi:heterodisulfide reductase-related iron-sulfur binding cluster [Candidatus Flexifilum breve]|uniref:heterodisulfide reductase-related iron-sulfur binding cluster n=1 Tax=Candidatus Flexifilum breve TaxID=3140694 RepID=UPI0031CCC145
MGQPALDLFDLIPGLDVRLSDASCCGIAGTYGFKVEKYDIGMAIGQQLFDQVRDIGARPVICDSETCRWRITHATGAKKRASDQHPRGGLWVDGVVAVSRPFPAPPRIRRGETDKSICVGTRHASS